MSPTPSGGAPGGGKPMSQWLVWVIVGGPVLVYVIGKLLVRN